jgi:hypothetical protein
VSVNVEPRQKVTFNLTYEQLLVRALGAYEHVINLDPGQIVPDLSVQVRIEESADITTLNVPALRVSNEINTDPAAGAYSNGVQMANACEVLVGTLYSTIWSRRIILKWSWEKPGSRPGPISSPGSGQGPVAGSCEHGSEHRCSTISF